jgi:hypothetical protein
MRVTRTTQKEDKPQQFVGVFMCKETQSVFEDGTTQLHELGYNSLLHTKNTNLRDFV